MKTSDQNRGVLNLLRTGRLLAGLWLGALPAAIRAADAPPVEGAQVPRSHTLFMGADIAVKQSADFHRVRDVSGGSFVLNIKGQPVFVPMTGSLVTIRVDQSLKLSRLAATLTNLKGERAYTVGNDPRIRNARTQADLTIALSDVRAKAEVAMVDADYSASHRSNDPGAPSEAQLNSKLAAASMNMENVGRQMQMLTDGTQMARQLERDLAQELYDAMEVNFEVSSPTPLNNPYVVLITRYREPTAKAGEVRNWIYAKSLDPIAAKAEKVHVLQGGFPPGFILEEFQVHLYNQGQEIATNVAPKRVPLTANEAMLYLMIEYLAAHKTDSVPASVALTTLPADFQQRLARGEGKAPLWVKVSTEGRIAEAYLDEECTKKLDDPYFSSALKEIRYKPALEKGKPIESVVRLKFGDLPRAM